MRGAAYPPPPEPPDPAARSRPHGVAAGAFGVVEGVVGARERGVDAGVFGRDHRDTDADREGDRLVVDGDRVGGDLAAQAFGELVRRGERGVGQRHEELLAAAAADGVGAADRARGDVGEVPQYRVAGGVAELVVDAL